MKHRDRVKWIRDWRAAGQDERWGYGRANLLTSEIFLISIVILFALIKQLFTYFFQSAPFSIVVITSLVGSFLGASFFSKVLLRLGLQSPLLKLLICLLLSSIWGSNAIL